MFRLLYSLLLVIISIQADARTTMREWLASMPDSVMPLLTKTNRLDFIDFHDARMEAVVTNVMDGESRMDTLTDDFVRISYTRSTEVEMKLLPVNDTTDILCMVTSVKAMVDDSRIAFYDASWHPIDASALITEPCIEDFRSILRNDSTEWAWSKMGVFFRTYHLDAESTALRCTLTTPDYLSREDRVVVAPYVRQEPITFQWTATKYLRNE